MPGTRKEPVLVFQGRRTVCHGKVSFPLGFQTEFSPTGPVGFSDDVMTYRGGGAWRHS